MTESKPKRRWFRFSLRTLFVLTTVFGVAMCWFERQLEIVRHRKQLLALLDSKVLPNSFPRYSTVIFDNRAYVLNGNCEIEADLQLSWIRRTCGDRLVPVICLPENTSSDEFTNFKTAFPEATVSKVTQKLAGISTVWPAPGHHFEQTGPQHKITLK